MAEAQGGGGFGGGGVGGGIAGSDERDTTGLAGQIDMALETVLPSNVTTNILTAGEPTEWRVWIKAGQVLVAEAKSNAFDPALQVVAQEKVVAENDDRFLGDQRPLLLWRSPSDQLVLLRCRSFKDKAGGQFSARFQVLDCSDLEPDKSTQISFDSTQPQLVRFSLRSGQFGTLRVKNQPEVHLSGFLSPIGLPNLRQERKFKALGDNTTFAPVTGDYYGVLRNPNGEVTSSEVELSTFEANPVNSDLPLKSDAGQTQVFAYPVKKGVVYRAELSGGNWMSRIRPVESPAVGRYDLISAENNPFYPQSDPGQEEEPLFKPLWGRQDDGRVTVFRPNRDGVVWLAVWATSPNMKLSIAPAATSLEPDVSTSKRLRIGDTDYWQVPAKLGDFITINLRTQAFRASVSVSDPSLAPVWSDTFMPDWSQVNGHFLAPANGSYLISVSGGGGSGDYELRWKAKSPQKMILGRTAEGSVTEASAWTLDLRDGACYLLEAELEHTTIRAVTETGAPLDLTWVTSLSRRYVLLKYEKDTRITLIVTPSGVDNHFKLLVTELGLKAP